MSATGSPSILTYVFTPVANRRLKINTIKLDKSAATFVFYLIEPVNGSPSAAPLVETCCKQDFEVD